MNADARSALTRRLLVNDVECPTCKAKPGEGCKSKKGETHARRFDAVELANVERAKLARWEQAV